MLDEGIGDGTWPRGYSNILVVTENFFGGRPGFVTQSPTAERYLRSTHLWHVPGFNDYWVRFVYPQGSAAGPTISYLQGTPIPTPIDHLPNTFTWPPITGFIDSQTEDNTHWWLTFWTGLSTEPGFLSITLDQPNTISSAITEGDRLYAAYADPEVILKLAGLITNPNPPHDVEQNDVLRIHGYYGVIPDQIEPLASLPPSDPAGIIDPDASPSPGILVGWADAFRFTDYSRTFVGTTLAEDNYPDLGAPYPLTVHSRGRGFIQPGKGWFTFDSGLGAFLQERDFLATSGDYYLKVTMQQFWGAVPDPGQIHIFDVTLGACQPLIISAELEGQTKWLRPAP